MPRAVFTAELLAEKGAKCYFIFSLVTESLSASLLSCTGFPLPMRRYGTTHWLTESFPDPRGIELTLFERQ